MASNEDVITKIGDLTRSFDALGTKFHEHVKSDEQTRTELARETKRMREFLFGENGKPGMAEVVRQHERWIAGQRRLIWLVVPLLIAGAGAALWQAVITTIAVKQAAGN